MLMCYKLTSKSKNGFENIYLLKDFVFFTDEASAKKAKYMFVCVCESVGVWLCVCKRKGKICSK